MQDPFCNLDRIASGILAKAIEVPDWNPETLQPRKPKCTETLNPETATLKPPNQKTLETQALRDAFPALHAGAGVGRPGLRGKLNRDSSWLRDVGLAALRFAVSGLEFRA